MKKFILLSALLAVTAAVYAQRVTITQETFGDQAYDTNGPGGGGGFATHWKASSVTTFTSTNGTIVGGNSDNSVRINNYGDFGTPSYPDASNSMKIHINHPTRYSGSWDTITFQGINIDGYTDFKVKFGWSKRPGFDNAAATYTTLKVNVRVDDGAWTLLDTTDLTQALAPGTFALDELDVPGVTSGSTMDIMFSSVRYQIAIDDITLTGVALPPRQTITKETFGDQAYDTNGPGGGGGFATHWKASSVTTFTSENGTISGGNSDNSVRINNYADFGTPGYPEASNSMKMHINHPTRYSGSWDTIFYNNIDVDGFYDFAVRFGMSKRPGFDGAATTYASLVVNVRADDGAWVMLDTTKLPQNLAPGNFAWAELMVPSSVEGESIDIMFSSRVYQIALDDIELRGRSTTPFINVSEIIVTSDGNSNGLAIDVDDQEMEFSALVLPSNATSPEYVWSVTDESLGSISQTGVLTPRKDGTIGVIATAQDGSEVADTVWVELTNQVVPVESISIAAVGGSTTINEFGGTIQFEATVLPADATDPSVTWSVNNNYGSITENGVFTGGFRSGTVEVTGTAGGLSDTETVTIELPVVGIGRNADVDLKVHPNEVTNVVTVEGENINQVRMLSELGNVVKSVDNEQRLRKIRMNVSDVSPGFYLMKVKTQDGKIHVRKLIKK